VTPDDEESMDEELPLDTPELPYEPPDVQEEPEVVAAGRAKAVAKVPKPIPVDILLAVAACLWSTASEL
jgi:hypothetical protein